MPDNDFDRWLNEHWFRRPDLHATFQRYHRRRADLNYVNFVCQFFLFGDYVRKKAGFNRRRGLLPMTLPAPMSERKLRGLHLSDVLPIEPREVLRLLKLGEQGYELVDSYLDSIKSICDTSPLISLFVQFAHPQELFNARGEPHDKWGAFFLLAIRDYLRTLRPYKTSDNERLAYKLFEKLRPEAKHINEPKTNVLMRIKRLKDAHPNWRKALDVLTSEYHRHDPTARNR